MAKMRHDISTIVMMAVGFPLWMSCSGDEPAVGGNGGDKIVFDVPAMTVETSGRSTFKSALEPGEAFGVLGYCVPYAVGSTSFNYAGASSVWALKRALCPPDVFYNQKVVAGSNGCTYDYNGGSVNNPKYWYRDGYDTDNSPNASVTGADQYRYSFIAYYPYGEGENGVFRIQNPSSAAEAGAPRLLFTMPQEGTEIGTPLRHDITPDAMLSVLYNRRKSDGNVRFAFSHVLTGLGFEINNFSAYDLVVHSVALQGSFYKSIVIDFGGDAVTYTFPADRYVGTYVLADSDVSLPSPDKDAGRNVTTSGLLGGEHLLLISGVGTSFGDNVKVHVEYTFNGVRKAFETARPGTFTPRPGIKYTSQLNFVGDAFVLQFVVDNAEQWEDGAGDDGDDSNDDVTFE